MIDSYSFGTIVINGTCYKKDIKIIRKKVIPEWWRKNGHAVTPNDIRDIINAGPEVLILGTGASGMMKPGNDVIRLLDENNIELITVPTAEAVNRFNQLMNEKKNIAAGFHLTC